MAIKDILIQSYAPAAGWDVAGRFHSPALERGADGIPTNIPLPTPAEMKDLSTGQLYDLSSRYGYIDPLENRVAIAQSRLASFNIRPGDARYANAMAKLEEDMKPALLGNARKMATRHETLRAVNGNMDQTMVYLNESDEPCEECEPLGGMEKTYSEFVADGDMPADRCLGGSNCLCTLMAVR